MNLEHPNAVATKIAQAKLSAICRAVGVTTPQDSADLHDLPLIATVKCRKRVDTDELTNEIHKYSSKSAHAPSAPAATAGSTPPWKRP